MLASAFAPWNDLFSYSVPAGAQADDERDFLGNTKPRMTWHGSTAVIPCCGPIIANAGFQELGFGATSHGIIGANFAEALDKGAKTIVLSCDSPGGTVRGSAELADAIYSARGKAQTVAYVGGLCASAAYWAASSCSTVCVAPTSQTGARGAIMQAVSIARALSAGGVDVETFLSRGSGSKAAGNLYKIMSPDEKAALQASVDRAGQMFADAVARNRPGKIADGDAGAILYGRDAKSAGLADYVVSGLGDVLNMADAGFWHDTDDQEMSNPRDSRKPKPSQRPPSGPAPSPSRDRASVSDHRLRVEWETMSKDQRLEYADHYESFAAYRRNSFRSAIRSGGGIQTAPLRKPQ
jgi:ClpP class serine protease